MTGKQFSLTSDTPDEVYEVVVTVNETRHYLVDARNGEEAESIVADLIAEQRENDDYTVEESDDNFELTFRASDQYL